MLALGPEWPSQHDFAGVGKPEVGGRRHMLEFRSGKGTWAWPKSLSVQRAGSLVVTGPADRGGHEGLRWPLSIAPYLAPSLP